MTTEKTILIVDDSPAFRNMVKFALNKLGKFSNQIFAQDGIEALEELEQEEVDLIISDVNMPNMDGIELLEKVKTDDRFKEIPMIMLTTEGMDEDKEKAKKLGADGYLQKPFKPIELIEVVEQFITY